MSALRDAIDKARSEMPIIEFTIGTEDWWQFDPMNTMLRWRHHRASNWSKWRMYPSTERFSILSDDRVDQSTVRTVPRSEADGWRSRPGFPCHQEAP